MICKGKSLQNIPTLSLILDLVTFYNFMVNYLLHSGAVRIIFYTVLFLLWFITIIIIVTYGIEVIFVREITLFYRSPSASLFSFS